jgi:hypothetical protein
MQKLNDLSRSPSPLDPDGTLIAVVELSLSYRGMLASRARPTRAAEDAGRKG